MSERRIRGASKRLNPALPVYKSLDEIPEGLLSLDEVAELFGIKKTSIPMKLYNLNVLEVAYWTQPSGHKKKLWRRKDLLDLTRARVEGQSLRKPCLR